jgi:ABC-type multidrug transport system fused ATPase/permease subunit
VAGATGSGKTSLLLALLGEMTLAEGSVQGPTEAMAYCAQEVWLMNGTIKNNIVFTSPWRAKRYQQVIGACGLGPDLAMLKAGDATMVGEKGVALSGGQKLRVALARAVYSESSVVILDDCLSALDMHTARCIVTDCITGALIADRTCILATHNLSLTLQRAAYVVVLSNGSVSVAGHARNLGASLVLRVLFGNTRRSSTRHILESSARAAESHSTEETPNITKPLFGEHDPDASDALAERPLGHIPWSFIRTYLTSMGGVGFWMLIALIFVAQQLIAIGANWWLGEFSNTYSHNIDREELGEAQPSKLDGTSALASPRVDIWYYLAIYALILIAYTAVSFGRLYAASIGSLNASSTLHRRLLARVLGAKFQFFDHTSHGALLNCFTQDIKSVDDNVMPMALGTLHFLVMMIFIIILIARLTPSFLVPGCLITLVYLAFGRFFLDSSRELKRIESEQKIPLHQHVSESLLGVVTIRVYAEEDHFIKSSRRNIDAVNRTSLYLGAVDRWLAFRLNVTGTLMSFIAGNVAIRRVDTVSAGAIGLSLTYAITFSENVLWLVRYHALNQQNFTA